MSAGLPTLEASRSLSRWWARERPGACNAGPPSSQLRSAIVIALITAFVAGCAFSVGCALILLDLGSARRRRQRSLGERLLPYRTQVGDEVELWLRRNSDKGPTSLT